MLFGQPLKVKDIVHKSYICKTQNTESLFLGTAVQAKIEDRETSNHAISRKAPVLEATGQFSC